MNLTIIPFNFSNISWDNLSSNICPFEAVAMPDYNLFIIFNFVMTMFLFIEMRYKVQERFFSAKRSVRNTKLAIVMMSVFNTVFVLNQFLLVPLFNYLRLLYGV